jgi:PAS domain-containing protein
MKVGSSDSENDLTVPSSEVAWRSLRRAERREWWLWLAAIMVTLLLTVGVVSFIVPELAERQGQLSWLGFPPAVRGLVAVVLLFDLYTIYQQWQIHRIRRQLFKREELFRLISDNATDMIAVVDVEGHRIYNSLSYQTVLGYTPEELRRSSSLEQIHPDDRERVKRAAEESRARRGTDAGISNSPQEWNVAGAGIDGQRYPRRQRRARKTCQSESRHHRAKIGARGVTAGGRGF